MATTTFSPEDLSIQELWDEAEESFQRLCGTILRTHHAEPIEVVLSSMYPTADSAATGSASSAHTVITNVASTVENLSSLITARLAVSPARLCSSAIMFSLIFLSKNGKLFCDRKTLFEALETNLARLGKINSREDLKDDSELPVVLQRSVSLILISFVDICGLVSGLALRNRSARVKAATLNAASAGTSFLSGILKPFSELIDRHIALEHMMASENLSSTPVESTQCSHIPKGATVEQLEELREALRLPQNVIERQQQTLQALSIESFKNSGADLCKNVSFLSWIDLASNARPSLLISGEPSSGKSHLMYAVLESLRSGELATNLHQTSVDQVIIAYHFFQQGNESLVMDHVRDAEPDFLAMDTVLKHLCFQIAQQDARYTEEMLSFLKTYDPIQTSLEDVWLNLHIGRPRDGVVHIFVIDGLDQAPKNAWEDFLVILNQQQRSKDKAWRTSPNWSNLRMLVSCTPESVRFDTLLDTPVINATDVNISNVKHFVEHKIAQERLWHQDTAYIKSAMKLVQETLPVTSKGQFNTIIEVLNHVRKAVDAQHDLATVESILLENSEQDTKKVVARTIDKLRQDLSIDDIKELRNILVWILHGQRAFTSQHLKNMSLLDCKDIDAKSYESILRTKFGAILEIGEFVILKEPFQAYFTENQIERDGIPESSRRRTTVLEIKMNGADTGNDKTFLLNLDEKVSLGQSDTNHLNSSSSYPTIQPGWIDSKVHITIKLLELLRDKRTMIPDLMLIHAFVCINVYLHEVFYRALTGWLEPEEMRLILSGIVRFLSDPESLEWHDLSELELHEHWLLDGPKGPEHIIHRWLNFQKAEVLLDLGDRRRLDTLRRSESGRFGFYKPLTRVMAKRWLQSDKGRPGNYYRWVATFMEMGQPQMERITSPNRSNGLSSRRRRNGESARNGVDEYLKIQDALRWAQMNVPDLDQNELFYENLGQTCYDLGLDTQAIRIYEAGKQRFREYWLFYADCAIARAGLKQFTSAVEEMKQGLQLVRRESGKDLKAVPYYIGNVQRLIDWYIQSQRHEEAIQECNALLDLDPFNYDVQLMLLMALQQSADFTHAKEHLAKLLSEPGQGGQGTKLIGLLRLAVNDFRLLTNLVILNQIIATAREAEMLHSILEAIDEMGQIQEANDDDASHKTIRLLFKGLVLASLSAKPDLETLGSTIEVIKQVIDNVKIVDRDRVTRDLQFSIEDRARAILATAYFQRLRMSLESSGNTEEDVKELEEMGESMPDGLPRATTLLANYLILAGQKEKARKLLSLWLKEHLDKMERLANDHSPTLVRIAVVLGHFKDKYNSLTAWSLVTPFDADVSPEQDDEEHDNSVSEERVAVKKLDGSAVGPDGPEEKVESAAQEAAEDRTDTTPYNGSAEVGEDQSTSVSNEAQLKIQTDAVVVSNVPAQNCDAQVENTGDEENSGHNAEEDHQNAPKVMDPVNTEVTGHITEVVGEETTDDGSPEGFPRWLRLKRIFASPIILNRHNIPWTFEQDDDDFVIMKTNIDEIPVNQIFAETKQLMDRSFGRVMIQCSEECGTEWMYASDFHVCSFCPATFLCGPCLERAKAGKLRNIWHRCQPDHEWLHVPRWSNQRYKEVGKGNVRVEGEIGEDGSITGGRIVPMQEWLDGVRKDWGLPAIDPMKRRRIGRQVRIVRSNSSGSLSDDC